MTRIGKNILGILLNITQGLIANQNLYNQKSYDFVNNRDIPNLHENPTNKLMPFF